jgi:acylphosphatase
LIRVFFIVHGTVQGVGYRHFVSRAAVSNQIEGIVRNVSDGSVEILAEGNPDNLKAFEKEIDISVKYGVQVFNIEKFDEQDPNFPKEISEYQGFVIEGE